MNLHFHSSLYKNNHTGDGDVWRDTPTISGIIIYSILVPIISFISLLGNGLSVCVLFHGEFGGSVYTYLTAFAGVNAANSLCLFLGGLSRGACWWKGWEIYDALVGLPIGELLNSFSDLAVVWVTIDRVVFLWNPFKITKPKWCTIKVARYNVVFSFIFCFFFNLPYCFIYDMDDYGKLQLKDWYTSEAFKVHNWMYMTIFAIIPSIILIIGNGFLISHIRKTGKISKKIKKCRNKERQISFVLVIIIICFLVTEIPTNLVARTTAPNLLFDGDKHKTDSKEMEIVRQIMTLIYALNLTVSFITYYLFCPQIFNSFKKYINESECCKRRKRRSRMHISIYFIQSQNVKGHGLVEANFEDYNKAIVAEKLAELAKRKFQMSRDDFRALEYPNHGEKCAGLIDIPRDGRFI